MSPSDDNYTWEWPTDGTPIFDNGERLDASAAGAWRTESAGDDWVRQAASVTGRIDMRQQPAADAWAQASQHAPAEPEEPRYTWLSDDAWEEPEPFKPAQELEPLDWDAMRSGRRSQRADATQRAEQQSRSAQPAQTRSQRQRPVRNARQQPAESPQRTQRASQRSGQRTNQRQAQSRRDFEQQASGTIPVTKWSDRDARQHRRDARGTDADFAWNSNANRRDREASAGVPMRADAQPVSRRAFVIGGAVVALAAVGFVGSRIYLHVRPIPAVIGGAEVELDPGTTYDDLVTSGRLPIKRGDLVAVDETTVLEVGGGEDYKVFANGTEVANTASIVKRKAEVTGESGANIMETSTAVETVVPYTVEMQGVGAISSVTQQGTDGLTIELTGDISGKVAESTESTPMQPCLIESYNVSPTEKLAALTFDDGPSQFTPQYLDIMKERGVKATFFMLGENVESFPDYAKRVADEGHQVATHSWSHPNMFELTSDQVRDQMVRSQDAIENATGVRPTVMRAPYGNWGQAQWEAVYDIITKQVIWNIDTEDWRTPGAAAIVSSVTDHIRPGRVILMHDGGGDRSQDVEALPQIIDQLHSAGYRFVTIDELDESGEHVQP